MYRYVSIPPFRFSRWIEVVSSEIFVRTRLPVHFRNLTNYGADGPLCVFRTEMPNGNGGTVGVYHTTRFLVTVLIHQNWA